MYTRYYGLSTEPFRWAPDPDFFFAGDAHGRALAHLRYGLGQGEGWVVITGRAGSGKTTLACSLLNELDPDSLVAAHLVIAPAKSEEQNLLREVLGVFGLAHEGLVKASLMTRLESFFKECAWDGKRILLIVDDAHHLSVQALQELGMLSNLQVSSSALLQIFLLGEDALRHTLATPALASLQQRVLASCQLDPLDEEETQAYIEHRLQLAGWQGEPAFGEEAYAEIHGRTQGIPGQINRLCDRLLDYGAARELHVFSKAAVAAAAGEPDLDEAAPTVVQSLPASVDEVSATVQDNQSGAVLGLTLEKRLQNQQERIDTLERRLAKLETSMSTLHRENTELAEALTRWLKRRKEN